jgi:polyvinyl alcohol dehydrogenase (cytochrome)
MAINLKTGRIAWTRQITQGDAYNSACGNNSGNCPSENGPDYDFGSSAMLVSAGGRDLLVAGQKSGVVTAVDPARNGAIVWQVRVGKGGVNGGVQWGMASDGERIFAAVSDVGRTANTSSDPASLARFILSPTEGGGLTALAIADGKTIWNVQRRHAAIRRRAAAPRSLRR